MDKLGVKILRENVYIPLIQVVVATTNSNAMWLTVQTLLNIIKKARQFTGEIISIEKYPILEYDEKVATGCTLQFKTERNLHEFSVCIQESDV